MNVIVSISITAGLSYGAFNLSSELRKRRYEDFVLRVSPIEGRQQQSWKFLLATAKISFEEPTGKLVTCRDVIDSGSQAHLISRRMEDLRYHFAVTD